MQNVIDGRRNREALAEELRILYVSLTRPMDKLVLLGTITDHERVMRTASMQKELGTAQGKSYLDYLLPTLVGCSNVAFKVHDRGGIGFAKKEKQEFRTRLQQSMASGFEINDVLSIEVEKRLGWKYAYPKALDTKSKYSVSELSRKVESVTLQRIETKALSVAANRGTIYHKIMEYIPFDTAYHALDQIRIFTDGMIERKILTEEEVATVDLSKVEQFFKSPIGRRACESQEIFREVSFNLLKEREEEEIIVQGTIDCYFKEAGKYILLDYKSNYVSHQQGSVEALAERYRPQIELYKEALEQIRGIEVAEMYLYLFSVGKEIQL
jgi:ATP-dependent helicase/nuclease subunit A